MVKYSIILIQMKKKKQHKKQLCNTLRNPFWTALWRSMFLLRVQRKAWLQCEIVRSRRNVNCNSNCTTLIIRENKSKHTGFRLNHWAKISFQNMFGYIKQFTANIFPIGMCSVLKWHYKCLPWSLFFTFCIKRSISISRDRSILLIQSLFVNNYKKVQDHFSLKMSFCLFTWLATRCCKIVVFDHVHPTHDEKVSQSVVSLKSLGSAELEVDDVLSSDSSLESAAEDLVVPDTSGSASCLWSEGSFRNRGTSSCSLVRRPRWSSTLLHWALDSMSRSPDAHKISC